MIQRLISESISVVPTDWRLLAHELYRLDMTLRDSFEPKLNRWLMDKIGFKSTPPERLIFRLRLDNAVKRLPSFSDHTIQACQVELDLPCSQPPQPSLSTSTMRIRRVFSRESSRSPCR